MVKNTAIASDRISIGQLPLGLLDPSVGEEPPRALRKSPGHHHDHQRQQRPIRNASRQPRSIAKALRKIREANEPMIAPAQ
jgi:hypothetical protein